MNLIPFDRVNNLYPGQGRSGSGAYHGNTGHEVGIFPGSGAILRGTFLGVGRKQQNKWQVICEKEVEGRGYISDY